MILRLQALQAGQVAPEVRIRCPACRHAAALRPGPQADALGTGLHGSRRYLFGQRTCPNVGCGAHIFVVLDYDSNAIVTSYPGETIDFDATELPSTVVEAFEEAIKCHAQQCYIAAAIMVRKTLEVVCQDRGAQGATLKDRIQALGNTVVLPQAMLDGLDDLRLLGNDAAHVESRVFDQVGQEEVEIAIDVTKEILKATYQYEAIMGRLRALRTDQPDV